MGNYIFPEMMIGKIPGNTPETVDRRIDKMIRFEESLKKKPSESLTDT
jgi:hypothetical protein